MMAASATLDLEPFIRDAIAKMNIEIDKRMAHEVAEALRGLGWQCIPPSEEDANV